MKITKSMAASMYKQIKGCWPDIKDPVFIEFYSVINKPLSLPRKNKRLVSEQWVGPDLVARYTPCPSCGNNCIDLLKNSRAKVCLDCK